ncbi:MAG: GAF domain-containing protein, partial [Chloroflexota bacterium]|nr:GAF domain-containing protein [Chloroflexota bacterium]
PERKSSPGTRWSVDEGLTGIVVRTGEPICADDYLDECARRGITPIDPAGLNFAKAWLGVPLRHHDQTLGVLIVTHTAPGVQFDAADIQLLSTVAAQAAAAIANAQLYARVEQQANQLALINRIGRTIASTLDPYAVPMLLVNELTNALDVEDAVVLIGDETDGALEVRYAQSDLERIGLKLPDGAGIAHAALERGEVVVEYDVAENPLFYPPIDADDNGPARSILCAPLHGRRLKGVIELRNKRSGRFTRADIELVQAIAEQATIALENAQLYDQTDEALANHIRELEQRNRQLAEVVNIGNALRSTFSVQALAEQITQTVHAMTAAPCVMLGLVDAEQSRVRVISVIGLDPVSPAGDEDRSMTLGELEAWIARSEPIGTFTYYVPGRRQLPAFEDAVILAIREPRGVLVGVIILESGEPAVPLTPDLVKTLEIVANQAGIALNNAMLYTEQQRTVDRLTALNALSLVVSTAQLSADEVINMAIAGAVGTTGGQSGGAVIVFEGRPITIYGTGATPRLGPEFLDRVVPAGHDFVELTEPKIPPSLAGEGIQRVLVVPLRGAKQTVGTFWIGYTQPTITQAERETAVLYAKMAGAVLENLYLADAVHSAHDRMASILNSTREGMLLIGEDDYVSLVNPAFARLLGADERGLRGRSIAELCSSDSLIQVAVEVRQRICEALQRVVAGSSEVVEGEMTVPAGPRPDLTWHVLPVRGAVPENTGALLVVRDVTADRQMERLRQDLASMIVHDLRSPLTNMMVSVDLLLKEATGPLNESQARILTIASRSSQQMLDLINALLDIRRLEQRTLDLHRRTFSLAGIAEAVIERLERTAEDKQVRLASEIDRLPEVRADADLIRRVLQNLIDNALKFSPSGSTVRVDGYAADAQDLGRGHAAGRWVVVGVHDQGPGIPEEYQQVIFDLFVQAPEGHGQGTGIGLAFCKLAVEAHGGKIWVESTLDQGSSFYFTLPAAR